MQSTHPPELHVYSVFTQWRRSEAVLLEEHSVDLRIVPDLKKRATASED